MPSTENMTATAVQASREATLNSVPSTIDLLQVYRDRLTFDVTAFTTGSFARGYFVSPQDDSADAFAYVVPPPPEPTPPASYTWDSMECDWVPLPTHDSSPTDPLINLTARRHEVSGQIGTWQYSDRLSTARYKLRSKLAGWNPQPWRYADKMRHYASSRWPAINFARDLLTAYVKAYLKEPDRIDLLGELYWATKYYAVVTEANNVKLYDKIPALHAFYAARQKLARYRGPWAPAKWADDQRYDNPLFEGWPTFSADTLAFYGHLGWMPGHLVHASIDEPVKVAYIKSVRDLMKGYADPSSNWVTRTTPGRYLTKMYPHLSADEVKRLANAHTQAHQPIEVKVARSESEVIHAIAEGPSESCMCNSYHERHTDRNPWFKGHVHPAAIYGHDEDDPSWDTDTEVLYFEVEGKVKGRVICNKLTKVCARIYGDSQKLLPAITKMGYTQANRALVGCRVRRIDDEKGSGHIMAYVDAGIGPGGGNLHYDSSGDPRWWVVCTEGEGGETTYVGYAGNGVTDGTADIDDDDDVRCDHCGNYYDPDTMHYAEGHGEICQGCLDEDFVYAVNRYGSDWCHNDDAVLCQSNDTWYHEDVTERNDVYECHVRDLWYHINDLCMTADGWAHEEEVQPLDEECPDGCNYALPDDAVRTEDGRWIHVDHAVTDPFDNAVYHYDDDLVRLRAPLRYAGGHEYYFTYENLRANLNEFWVVGSTVVLNTIGGRDNIRGRGAIPLLEYILTFGVDDLSSNREMLNALYDIESELEDDTKENANDYQHAA